ncbi:MAG: multidrug efflux SMR transporter [Lysobacteraceae bacterium]|nr:MAG: multidrug efflux SMR transporter [Xanthomonadaceae bacterium]
MNLGYLYLSVAIAAEVIATSALKASDGFTKPLPTTVVLVGYGVAFYFLSLVLKTVPVGVAYAIWSGAGIVLIALVGWLVLKQSLDAPAIAGMALIIAGVAVIQLFSRTAAH